MASSPFPSLFADVETLSWDALRRLPWVAALEACPQDPAHHAEGNVLIHTQMVLEVLRGLPAYRAMSPEDRRIVFLACLMHDIGKPAKTRTDESGAITSKGHSRAGELLARQVLYEMGVPFDAREAICGLVRFHQIPFYAIEQEDPRRVALEASFVCRSDLLAVVAEADIRGRIAKDVDRVVDSIALFVELCREERCLSSPRSFPSDHTRVVYFRGAGRSPDVPIWDDTKGTMVLMSGLPGAGKDTFIRAHLGDLPVVSLDDLREELDVDPSADQGAIVQAARERAREHLRRGESFVWNATNLNRQRRGPLLSLAADYGARTRIVYVEVPEGVLLAQNRGRKAAVPERVIRSMIERWEIPTLLEAHEITYAIR